MELAGLEVDVGMMEIALEGERYVRLGHLVEVLVRDLGEPLLRVVAQGVGGEHVPEGDVDLHGNSSRWGRCLRPGAAPPKLPGRRLRSLAGDLPAPARDERVTPLPARA